MAIIDTNKWPRFYSSITISNLDRKFVFLILTEWKIKNELYFAYRLLFVYSTIINRVSKKKKVLQLKLYVICYCSLWMICREHHVPMCVIPTLNKMHNSIRMRKTAIFTFSIIKFSSHMSCLISMKSSISFGIKKRSQS